METTATQNTSVNTEIESAKALLKKHGYIQVMFHIDDIILHAKDKGLEITQEQAIEIAEILDKKHDANEGINWNTIDTAIGLYFDKAA